MASFVNGKPVAETVIVEPANVEKIDENANGNTYFGAAAAGSATSAAAWQIQRKSVSGSVTTFEYADGDSEFDNVWDNRTTLTYK